MQKVLVTDEDFQEEAVRLGLSPDGVTAENFGERLIEAERLEQAQELGLSDSATWREIRDARRALREQSIEALHISPQCKSHYAGEWIAPARLNQDEINEILDRLPVNPRRVMHQLLMRHGNRVELRIFSASRTVNQALREPIAGKYYRLASGTDRAGRYYDQLWEVRPKK